MPVVSSRSSEWSGLVRIKAGKNSGRYQPTTTNGKGSRSPCGKQQQQPGGEQQLADQRWSSRSHRLIGRRSIPEGGQGGRRRQISDPCRSGTRKRHPHEACAAQRRALEWTGAWRQSPRLGVGATEGSQGVRLSFPSLPRRSTSERHVGLWRHARQSRFFLYSRLLASRASPTWSHHERSLVLWCGCPGGVWPCLKPGSQPSRAMALGRLLEGAGTRVSDSNRCYCDPTASCAKSC